MMFCLVDDYIEIPPAYIGIGFYYSSSGKLGIVLDYTSHINL